MLRKPTTLMIFAIFTSSPVAVQNGGYPLPNQLQRITRQNAVQVQKLALIGGDLPDQLAWSPDGKTLAAGTSAGVKLYDVAHLDAAPFVIPGGLDVSFNTGDNRLVSGGKTWDVKTGKEITGTENNQEPVLSPSGTIHVRTRTENHEIIVSVQHDDGTTITLHTGFSDGYTGIVFSPVEQFAALKFEPAYQESDLPPATVQLWDILHGRLIASLQQHLEFLDTVAFHADGHLLITASYTT
jgi:WD40 repeat protein